MRIADIDFQQAFRTEPKKVVPLHTKDNVYQSCTSDETYWNINTAGVFRTSYGARNKVVYDRHATEKQSAETAEASLSVEQNGTTPSTSMNASIQQKVLSEGKDSK